MLRETLNGWTADPKIHDIYYESLPYNNKKKNSTKMPKCDIKTRYIPATFAWALLLATTVLFFYYP